MVSLEKILLASCGKFAAVASDAATIRYGHSMATSITNVLRSPVFCKRPKIAPQERQGSGGRGDRGSRQGQDLGAYGRDQAPAG